MMRTEVLNNVQLFNTRLSQMAEPEDLKNWVAEENTNAKSEIEKMIDEKMKVMRRELEEKVTYKRAAQNLLNFDVVNSREHIAPKVSFQEALTRIEESLMD